MASIIHVCMTCIKLGQPAETHREPAPASVTEDLESHGYCVPHGKEYVAEMKQWAEDRKQQKGKK